MKLLFGVFVLAISVCIFGYCAATLSEAPTGFDNKTNGMVDDATHAVDQAKFDEIEQVAEGLGPLYNAQSCRECHQNPTSGGGSQISELRVGHRGPGGKFENPDRKSTRLNSSHLVISYAVFCLKKKKNMSKIIKKSTHIHASTS